MTDPAYKPTHELAAMIKELRGLLGRAGGPFRDAPEAHNRKINAIIPARRTSGTMCRHPTP